MSDMTVFVIAIVVCLGAIAWVIWGQKNNHPKDGDLP